MAVGVAPRVLIHVGLEVLAGRAMIGAHCHGLEVRDDVVDMPQGAILVVGVEDLRIESRPGGETRAQWPVAVGADMGIPADVVVCERLVSGALQILLCLVVACQDVVYT